MFVKKFQFPKLRLKTPTIISLPLRQRDKRLMDSKEFAFSFKFTNKNETQQELGVGGVKVINENM